GKRAGSVDYVSPGSTFRGGMGQFGRRHFVVAGGAVLCASFARAQTAKTARVGFFSRGRRDFSSLSKFFLAAMRDLGWIEGRNLEVLWLFSDANSERAAAYATELANLKPQVIVAAGSTDPEIVQRAT